MQRKENEGHKTHTFSGPGVTYTDSEQRDEVHPICGNCSKRKIRCDFAPLQDDRPPRRQDRVKIEPFEKWLKTEDSSSRGLSPLSSSRLSTASLLPDTASVRVRQVTPHLSSAF